MKLVAGGLACGLVLVPLTTRLLSAVFHATRVNTSVVIVSGQGRRGSIQVAREEDQMKPNAWLTIASLLSILLMIFHLTDDIVRGMTTGESPTSSLSPSWPSGCTARWCSMNGGQDM